MHLREVLRVILNTPEESQIPESGDNKGDNISASCVDVGKALTIKMKNWKLLVLLFVTGCWLLRAAETDVPSESALLGLFHHSGEIKEFRESAAAMLDSTKKVLAENGYPELPISYWDEMKQEMSLNDYGAWWSSVAKRHLNASDVAALTKVLGSDEKKELLFTLGQLGNLKKGAELEDALDEYRKRKGADLINEIILVGKTSLPKFVSALKDMKAEEREVMVRLATEADKRVRARRK